MIKPNLRTPPADANKAVTEEYTKAVNLDCRIKTAAQLAQQHIYDMCMGFKEMRDSKLFKELGYKSFEEYCEQETGFKRTQVYNYISIVENLPKEFVQPVEQIGMRKLLLLSKLSETERTEIAENTDLESTTVRELEAQIKTLKEKAEARESYFHSREKADEGTIDTLKKTKIKLQNRIYELENEIKELENRPIEVTTAIPENCVPKSAYEDMVRTYTGQLDDKDEEFIAMQRKTHAEKTELEKQLAEVKEQLAKAEAAEPETVTVADTDSVFKAYYTNAYAVFDELVKFVKEHKQYTPKVNKLIDAVKKSLEANL